MQNSWQLKQYRHPWALYPTATEGGGTSAHEQAALELLRERLPDSSPFRAWSNFEFIAEDGSINEVDALIASTDRVYLVEIKHWSGIISGNQSTWVVTPVSYTHLDVYKRQPGEERESVSRKLERLLTRFFEIYDEPLTQVKIKQ